MGLLDQLVTFDNVSPWGALYPSPLWGEADQAQQAREAAAARLGRTGCRRTLTVAAPAPPRIASTPQRTVPSDGVTANNIMRSSATGVPIIGGLLNKMEAATNATLAPVLNRFFAPEDQLAEPTWSGRHAHSLRDQEGADARFAKEHPYADAAANLAGSMALFGPIGETAAGAKMLGLTGGPLAEKMLQGAMTQTAVGGVDAVARGKTDGSRLFWGAVSGAARPVGRQAAQVLNFIPYLHRLP